MATKQKTKPTDETDELGSFDDFVPVNADGSEAAPPKPAAAARVTVPNNPVDPVAVIQNVLVELPTTGIPPATYIPRKIELRLTEKQGRAYRQVTLGIHETAAKLDNGKYVNSGVDAVRWILERIADSLAPEASEQSATS